MLLATMRVTPCGEESLWRDFSRVAPQALRVARLLLEARAVAASPLAPGNKKAQPCHPPLFLWEMADCAFNSQRARALIRRSIRASYTAYYMLSRTLQLGGEPTLCLRRCQSVSLSPLNLHCFLLHPLCAVGAVRVHDSLAIGASDTPHRPWGGGSRRMWPRRARDSETATGLGPCGQWSPRPGESACTTHSPTP